MIQQLMPEIPQAAISPDPIALLRTQTSQQLLLLRRCSPVGTRGVADCTGLRLSLNTIDSSSFTLYPSTCVTNTSTASHSTALRHNTTLRHVRRLSGRG